MLRDTQMGAVSKRGHYFVNLNVRLLLNWAAASLLGAVKFVNMMISSDNFVRSLIVRVPEDHPYQIGGKRWSPLAHEAMKPAFHV